MSWASAGIAYNPRSTHEIPAAVTIPTVADVGHYYTRDVAGITEFHYTDSAGSEIQFSSAGVINAAAAGFGAAAANRLVLTDAVGTLTHSANAAYTSGGQVSLTSTDARVLVAAHTDAINNAGAHPIRVIHNTSGVVANNIGSGIRFDVQTSTTNSIEAGDLNYIWVDITHATRTAAMTVALVYRGATPAETFRTAPRGSTCTSRDGGPHRAHHRARNVEPADPRRKSIVDPRPVRWLH